MASELNEQIVSYIDQGNAPVHARRRRLARYRVMPTVTEAYAHLSDVDDSLPQPTSM